MISIEKYTGIYATSGEVSEALSAQTLHRPYMAIVKEPYHYIDWNGYIPTPPTPPGPDYSQMPLTFEIVSGGTVAWALIKLNTDATTTIQYRKNNGNWQSVTAVKYASALKIEVVAGDILEFRGNNNAYSLGDKDYCHFRGSASFNVYGNIMSLINPTNFAGLDQLYSSYTFASLFFENTRVLSAENLVMPATGLTSKCYCNMFNGCTGLTTAPELLASTLNEGSYQNMFYGCSSLNYIKCLATDKSAQNCTDMWVNGVQTVSGTFVAHPNAFWVGGSDGIPNNWTRINISI